MTPQRPVPVSEAEFAAAGPDGWVLDGGAITATYCFASFTTAGAFVAAVAAASDDAAHHPDLELAYPGRVRITSTTHDAGGLTTLDTALAATIDRLAVSLGGTVRVD